MKHFLPNHAIMTLDFLFRFTPDVGILAAEINSSHYTNLQPKLYLAAMKFQTKYRHFKRSIEIVLSTARNSLNAELIQ